MKVLIIHNKYGKHSGEETVVYFQIKMLEETGHEVITYFRSSEEIKYMFLGKFKAFFLSLFNPRSFRDLRKIIRKEKPDLLHIHNLYPLISPSILPYLKSFDLPIVMTVHNYRLLCPNGLFFTKGSVCEKCTSKTRELSAIVNNCENSLFKSTGYALRNFLARIFKYYTNNIDYFLCLTVFQKNKLVNKGFNDNKILVINNVCDYIELVENDVENKEYIGYVGRISQEKGIETLLEVASKMPHVNFKLAGTLHSRFKKKIQKYKNIEVKGFLSKNELLKFYKNAKFIIFPSICYETFGLTLIEAMSQKRAVIASNIAGVPEIVENNKTGLLFQTGDAEDLQNKISYFLNNPQKAKEMGENGYIKLNNNFRSRNYHEKLMQVYNKVTK